MEDGSSLGERIVALPAVKITDISTRNSELTSSKSCNSSRPHFLICTGKKKESYYAQLNATALLSVMQQHPSVPLHLQRPAPSLMPATSPKLQPPPSAGCACQRHQWQPVIAGETANSHSRQYLQVFTVCKVLAQQILEKKIYICMLSLLKRIQHSHPTRQGTQIRCQSFY